MADIYYNAKDLYFEYGDFTPATEETCGVYFLSSNTKMLALALIQHYGKWRNRYTTDLSLETKPKLTEAEYDEIFTIVDLAIKELMADCNLDRMSHSLTEIEFTLKHLLTKLTDETEIKFFIDKPAEPPKLEDGTWDLTVNNAITSPGMSVFMVGSLLENNSITDVLKIATLDDGTIQFPDINPFNLESKLDGIRTDINLSQVHFTGEWTSLFNWFASSFRESPYSPAAFLNNPFGTNTIYQMMLESLNSVEKTYTTITIPFYGSISVPKWLRTDSFLADINQNIATSFNENYDSNTRLATNSYFRYLHTWLNSDWKLFQTVSEEIRDCICEAKSWLEQINIALWGDDSTPQLQFIKNSIDNTTTAIQGLDLSPTINNTVNVDPTPVTVNVDPTPVTVNVDTCCDELVEATRDNGDAISEARKEIVKSIENDGTITTDNGDGTYTTNPIVKPDVPIDPTIEDSPDSTTYQTVSLTKLGNSQDAVCGFIYYSLSQFADFMEYLIGWMDGLVYIIKATGIDKWAISQLGIITMATNNIYIGKLGKFIIRGIASKYMGLGGVVVSGLPEYIREVRDDLSCGSNRDDLDVGKFEGEVIQALQVLSLQNQQLDFASYLIHIFYSYGLYSPLENATGINIASYAQYCPCPLEGDFSGHWYNNDAVNPYHLYLTANGSGEGWNGLSATGGQYYQNYFDMVQDVNNPLFTSGKATVYNNVMGTLSGVFNGVSFTLNQAKDQITMDNGIVFTKVV